LGTDKKTVEKSIKKCCKTENNLYYDNTIFLYNIIYKMAALTVLQAKLINAWLVVRKFQKLAERLPKLYEKHLEAKIDAYFDIWFEINQMKLETIRIDKLVEQWETEQDALETLDWPQFKVFAYDKCLDNLEA